ncbi:MAG TPA: magnesium/cobalt transporter CorA [Prolixibacteraceae bacterium]|nr:magnesium/cobalt transporter CorA [Prolixibacteraceae bacterium]
MARFLKSRKVLIGKSPGDINFVGKQKMEQARVRLISYNGDNIIENELEKIEQTFDLIAPDKINWLNIDGLHDKSIIIKVGKHFGLSPLVLDDIVNTDQRPKVVEDGENLVFFLKMLLFKEKEQKISAEHIVMVLGKNYVLTFQEKVGDFFDPIRNRLSQNIGKLRGSSSDYLLYRIFDTIADNYLLCVGLLGELIEADEENILSNHNKELVQNIYRHKTEISYIRKTVRPAKEITTKVKNFETPYIDPDNFPFFADLDDLVTQTLETVEIYYTMTSDQLNIYNTNLTNSANDVMKVLTIFAAIFIPLTFIVGIYGTNFDYLPELHYRYSYFIMWGIMIIVTLVMLWYFKRKKWL